MVKDNEVAFIEIKSKSDKLRPNQKEVIESLAKSGLNINVVYERKSEKVKSDIWLLSLVQNIPQYLMKNKRFEFILKDFDGLGIS